MKIFRGILSGIAILTGISGAFAKAIKAPCSSQTQYYFNNRDYVPAGIEGTDYSCVAEYETICTCINYPLFDGYIACKTGKMKRLQ